MSETTGGERKGCAEGVTATGDNWHIHYTVKGEGPAVIMMHGGGPGASGPGLQLQPQCAGSSLHVVRDRFPGLGLVVLK